MDRTEALAVSDQAFLDALAQPQGVTVASLDNGPLVAVYDADGAIIGVRDYRRWSMILESVLGVSRSDGGAVADSDGAPPDTREAAEAARQARLEAQKAHYEERAAAIAEEMNVRR